MQAFVIAYYEIIRSFRQRYFFAIMFLMPMMFILILGNALSNEFNIYGSAPPATAKAFALDERAERDPRLFDDIKRITGLRLSVISTREEILARVKADDNAAGMVISDSGEPGEAPSIRWEIVPGRSLEANATVEALIRGFTAYKSTAALREQAGLASGFESEHGERMENVRLEKGLSYSALQYYSASMLIMSQLYTGMAASLGMAGIRQSRLLARLVSMPIPNGSIVMGLFIGRAVISAIQTLFLLVGSSLLYGVDWGERPFLLAAVCALSIVSSISLAVIVGLLLQKIALIIAFWQSLVVTMMFLSGGYSPIMGAMGERLGPWTFNYWVFQPLLHMMAGGEWAGLPMHLSVLGAIAGISVLAAFMIYWKAGFYEHSLDRL